MRNRVSSGAERGQPPEARRSEAYAPGVAAGQAQREAEEHLEVRAQRAGDRAVAQQQVQRDEDGLEESARRE